MAPRSLRPPGDPQETEKAQLEAKHRSHGTELEEAAGRAKERAREVEALRGRMQVRIRIRLDPGGDR